MHQQGRLGSPRSLQSSGHGTLSKQSLSRRSFDGSAARGAGLARPGGVGAPATSSRAMKLAFVDFGSVSPEVPKSMRRARGVPYGAVLSKPWCPRIFSR